jgi:hypothetical protein
MSEPTRRDSDSDYGLGVWVLAIVAIAAIVAMTLWA